MTRKSFITGPITHKILLLPTKDVMTPPIPVVQAPAPLTPTKQISLICSYKTFKSELKTEVWPSH